MMVCDNCGQCEACGSVASASSLAGSASNLPQEHLEHGFKRFWRPAAGYIYLLICIFDFVGGPIWVEYDNQQVNSEAFAEIRLFEDKEVQMIAIEQIDLGSRSWSPLTLMGGAFFHIAFGAILGVAAFSRGKEKVAAINNSSVEEPRRRILPKSASVTVTTETGYDEEQEDPAPRLRDI